MESSELKKIITLLDGVPADGTQLVAVPLDLIPTGEPLGFSLYIALNFGAETKYIQIRRENDTLTTVRRDELAQRVDSAYVARVQWGRFLKTVLAERDLRQLSLTQKVSWARALAVLYLQSAEIDQDLSRENYARMLHLSRWVAHSIGNQPSLRGLVQRYRDPALYQHNHAFNVCLASTLTAGKLGLGREAQEMVALGTLLHNVGNVRTSRKLLAKRDKISQQEWQEIRQHPNHGGEILHALSAPREVVLVSLQHHERLDGAGYPDTLAGDQIHLFAKICSAADVCDALQSSRLHESALDRDSLLTRMRALEKQLEGRIVNILTDLEK